MDKIGVVLAGGGAKGAYHLGALRAIDEFNFSLTAVSGASMGALNSAFVSSANGNLLRALEGLHQVWDYLSEYSPLKINRKLHLNLWNTIPANLIQFTIISSIFRKQKIATKFTKYLFPSFESFYDSQYLEEIFKEFISIKKIQNGLPLFVSCFESSSLASDLVACFRFYFKNSRDSIFVHLNNLDEDLISEYLLGSAAIPMLLKAREVDNKRLIDGAMGGVRDSGNVPITPLITHGCNRIFVIHLDHESHFMSSDFANTQILEIRPSTSLGGLSAMMKFDKKSVSSLISQGYEDAMSILEYYTQAMKIHDENNTLRARLILNNETLINENNELNETLTRLNALQTK